MRLALIGFLFLTFNSLSHAYDDMSNRIRGGFGNESTRSRSYNYNNNSNSNDCWLFCGSKEKKQTERIDSRTLEGKKKRFQRQYDPYKIVPDRCIVRNETITIPTNRGSRTIRAGGGGYNYYMWKLRKKGKRPRQMKPCPDDLLAMGLDFNQLAPDDQKLHRQLGVAEDILINVDKAGKNNRSDRGRTQKMHIKITYKDGRVENWNNWKISTGSNHWAYNDPTQGKADFETTSGTYELNENVGTDMENTAAYCVRSQNDSFSAAMPYAVRITGGIFIHAGHHDGVTGSPASHGCVRVDFDQARKLYCLMRKKGEPGSPFAKTNYMRTTVKVHEDMKKIPPPPPVRKQIQSRKSPVPQKTKEWQPRVETTPKPQQGSVATHRTTRTGNNSEDPNQAF